MRRWYISLQESEEFVLTIFCNRKAGIEFNQGGIGLTKCICYVTSILLAVGRAIIIR